MCKDGPIKDRNSKDLTEAEDIKKRWQEYTKEQDEKDLMTSVVTHLEPDILECEVKWALGSIDTNKASRGDGIPAELVQILKDDSVKVLYSMSANLENLATVPEKVSFHSNPKQRRCQKMFKLPYNCFYFTC